MHQKNLWELGRPAIDATPTARKFVDVPTMFDELHRPFREALDALLPAEPGQDGEPDATPPVVNVPEPRVLDWACELLPGFVPTVESQTAMLTLLVLPGGQHEVERWCVEMSHAQQAEIRTRLAELGEQYAAAWATSIPDQCDVSELINHTASSLTEEALAATGDTLATKGTDTGLLTDLYQPVRTIALKAITAVVEHAAKHGWTAVQMAEAWDTYCHDVDPVQY